MASIEEQIRSLNEERMSLWEKGKEVLTRADGENRGLSAEERESYDRIQDQIVLKDKMREAILSTDKAEKEYENLQEELRRVTTVTEKQSLVEADRQDKSALERFFRRDARTPGPNAIEIDLTHAARAVNAYTKYGVGGDELRAVIAGDTGASGGSLTIPTTVATTIYAFMTASVALRRMNTTIIDTAGGETMTFPRVSTHGIATQVANQDTAIAGTNAVLGQMTLNAFPYGQLVAVANDFITDSGTDVVGFVARNIGRAVGQITATAYVTGSGSGQPNGVMTALGGAGTIATGGSLILGPAGQVVEKLIDLQYSVVDSYRQNGASWLMRDLTGAAVRKLRDGAGGTAGAFIWQPSQTVGMIGGQPDTFLGDPVFFDPNVASMASDAKIIAYGDFSAYYIRDVQGFQLERSDDLLFDKNQVAYRGYLRTDGDLIDSNAINLLHQVVA